MDEYLTDLTTDHHQGGGVRPDIVDRRPLLDDLDRYLFGDLAA